MATEDPSQARAVRTETRRTSERSNSYSRAARRASRAAATPALGGWGTYATIIAFGLAVCLTGYLAIGDNDRFYVVRSAATAPAAPPIPAPDEARQDAVAKTPRSPMPSLATDAVPASSLANDSEALYATVTDEHLAIFESLAPAPREIPDRKAAREGKGAKDGVAARAAANARNGRVARAVAPAPVAPMAIAASPLPESMATDRFQQFASALGRCERENVIVGLVCKERARLQYCEGEWGVAPECPVAIVSLNTR